MTLKTLKLLNTTLMDKNCNFRILFLPGDRRSVESAIEESNLYLSLTPGGVWTNISKMIIALANYKGIICNK